MKITEIKMITLELPREVDLLFASDNPGPMGAEKSRLAQDIPTFITALEAVGTHY